MVRDVAYFHSNRDRGRVEPVNQRIPLILPTDQVPPSLALDSLAPFCLALVFSLIGSCLSPVVSSRSQQAT